MDLATALFDFDPATNTICQETHQESCLPMPQVTGSPASVLAVDTEVAATWLQLLSAHSSVCPGTGQEARPLCAHGRPSSLCLSADLGLACKSVQSLAASGGETTDHPAGHLETWLSEPPGGRPVNLSLKQYWNLIPNRHIFSQREVLFAQTPAQRCTRLCLWR